MFSRLVTFLVILFLFGPTLLVVWVSFSPGTGLMVSHVEPSLRWYHELFRTNDFLESFWQSVVLALCTTVISLSIGTIAGYALGRYDFRGKAAVSALILSPIMIPGVAFGVGLAQFFGELGIRPGYHTLIIGHVIITTPFVVRAVTASMLTFDRTVERAAQDLGASWFQMIWRVSLPMLRPGLFAGGLFAIVMSFDELAISLFVSGLYIVPLPVRIFTYLQTVLEPTVAAASVFLILISLCSILVIEKLVGLDRVLGIGRR